MNKLLLSFLCLLSIGTAFANEVPKKGYLWYNLPKEDSSEKPKEKQVPLSSLSYKQQTQVIKYYMDEALHRAIHTQKVKDAEMFITMQHYFLKKSSAFGHNFQYAMMLHPEYNSTVKRPVSAAGEKLNQTRIAKENQVSINNLANEYGLLFFYKGNDAYSKAQANVLISFASQYHFNYSSISVDGVTLPNLENSQLDHGQARALNVKNFPSIMLVHPKTKRVLPISSSFLTQGYLLDNFNIVVKQLNREKYGEGVINE